VNLVIAAEDVDDDGDESRDCDDVTTCTERVTEYRCESIFG